MIVKIRLKLNKTVVNTGHCSTTTTYVFKIIFNINLKFILSHNAILVLTVFLIIFLI